MLQVTLPGDTGRADVPLRPREMDAVAHFVRSQGYLPQHSGLEPVGHSNYAAWPVPAEQILPEPAVESTMGANAGLLVERPEEPLGELPEKPSVGPTGEWLAKPAAEPALGREPPRPEQAAMPDAKTKSHTIVWKAFPKARS